MTLSNTQTVGLVGATPIIAELGGDCQGGTPQPVRVVLTSNYQMLGLPGYPSRPSFTGAATPQYPHTVSSGTTLSLLQPEAAALVTAGAANYV